jgi:Fic-DOC domain mobile mystery protein B
VDWDDLPDGATPLPEDQREGLKQSWITTMDDLNEAEADNILTAVTDWYGRHHTVYSLLDDKTVRDLHRNMLDEVWGWAGTYRHRELNIGIDPFQVAVAVKDLVEDAKYWFAEDSAMDVDLAAVRFHHRLVAIHPFANGNGRHSRLLTDLLLRAVGATPFTWGSKDLGSAGETRQRYIVALRDADGGDFAALLDFVRT